MKACDAWTQDIQAFAVADFSAGEHALALRRAAGKCAVVTRTRAVFEGA